jgi:hypothetical protein
MTELQKVDLDKAAGSRPEYWSQQVVGEANGSLFKVAKGIHETIPGDERATRRAVALGECHGRAR